jgi:hypothetical protein
MTRRWPWIAGGVAVLAAAAVASAVIVGAHTPTPLPSDGSVADPVTPNALTDRLSILVHSPGPAIPASRATDYVSMPWLFFALRDGGKAVQIVAATGDASCVKPAGYRVKETDSYVEIWAYSKRAPAGTHCAKLVTEYRTNIPLTAPLGDRTLLHPPTAPDWPASRAFDTQYTYATP